MSDTQAKILSILGMISCEPMEGVTRDTTLESLRFDSLDYVEAAVEIEADFDIDVPDADAAAFVTVGDVVDYVERKRAAAVTQ